MWSSSDAHIKRLRARMTRQFTTSRSEIGPRPSVERLGFNLGSFNTPEVCRILRDRSERLEPIKSSALVDCWNALLTYSPTTKYTRH